MKNFKYFLLVFLIGISASAYAQNHKFLPKNSRKLINEEMRSKRISASLPVYTAEGKKLGQLEGMKYMSSPDYFMEVYGDKSANPVAILVRKSTDAEREAKLKMFMSMDRTGDWKNKEAPAFAAMTMEELGVNLKEMKGSVVALNFWFIGCKPCILEMPELNELVEKYEGKNVKFIAIALDSKEKLIPFLQRTDFDYDIIPAARNLAQLYNVSSYPSHFLIDQEGKVQFFQAGYNGALVSILDKRIEGLLEKSN